MRLRVWLLLTVAYVTVVHAQQSKYDPGVEEAKINLALRSNSPVEVAWAAFRAKSTCCGRFNASLREALQTAVASPRSPEQILLIKYLLDAMIQSRAVAPLSALLPLYNDYPDAILAVMANDMNPLDDRLLPLLMSAEQENNAPRWLLLAALLRRSGSRALDEHLLDELHFEFVIEIVEGNYIPVLKHELRGVTIGGVMGRLPGPFGWPEPPGQYCLTVTPELGDEVIVAYLEHVYLRRKLGDENSCGRIGKTSRSQLSLLLLSQFPPRSSDWPDFPLLNGGKGTIVWQGADETRQLLQRATRQYVDDCVRLLQSRGRLGMPTRSWTEAELRSRISISLVDLRYDKKVPIPEVNEMMTLRKNR